MNGDTEREALGRAQWEQKVISERARHEALGWTREHDLAHGPDHLILETLEYAARGDTVAVGALKLALRDVLTELTERVRAEQRETDITAVVALTGRYGTRNYEDDNYASGAGDALDDATAAIREASDD